MQKKSHTIALFGGSFDPPHVGHEAVVKALLQKEEIDKVVIMPTFLNPFKDDSYAPAELRLKWLREIFQAYEKVEVDEYEVKQNRKVPTIESVEYLLKKYSTIFLVIGADNLQHLQKWHKFEKLQEMVTFVVASRDAIHVPDSFITLDVNEEISSTELRKNIKTAQLSAINAEEIKKYYKEKNAK